MLIVGVGDLWVNLLWLLKVFMGWINIRFVLDDYNFVDEEIC